MTDRIDWLGGGTGTLAIVNNSARDSAVTVEGDSVHGVSHVLLAELFGH